MASMPNFEQVMITREDFEENGSIIIDKKCFDWMYLFFMVNLFMLNLDLLRL